MSRPRLAALLLVLVTLAAYLPVTHDEFLTYDDDDYVAGNPMVQDGLTWSGVQWAFTTFHAGNWHPVTWLSHMADCDLFALNAGAHHGVNVLFHAANVALLFFLLLRLTQKIWPSVFVAALFAWHPLHVESVAWVAERKDVLSTFFALLTLLNYVQFTRTKSMGSYLFALVFFALGLMSKPMLVTLPFVLLLLDFWPLRRFSPSAFRGALLIEKIPFFVLAGAACVLTLLAQRAGEAVVTLNVLPVHYRLENAAVAATWYLLKIFWPTRLAVIYPFVIQPPVLVGFALVVLAGISALAWRVRERHPCWLVGWLWFLGTLVPVIGLVQVGGTMVADRYTYIPAIGIFLALAFGLPELAAKHAWLKRTLPLAAGFVLLASLSLTECQLRYWRTSEMLFRHTLAVTQNNLMARVNLGLALERQGRAAEALSEYREALRLDPDYEQIHFSTGNLLEKMGEPVLALAEYQQCLRLNPQNPVYHAATGNVLAELGQTDAALREFAEAERLNAHYAQPHLEAAKWLFQQDRSAEAVRELHAAAQAEPDNFQSLATVAHYLAANADAGARDGVAALQLALKADAVSGHLQPLVLDVLGMAYAATGDFSNAETCAQNALQLAAAVHLTNNVPLQTRLEFYQNHQPWRESFRATNAPATTN